MAKQSIESLIQGGKATAAPPLGPALGPLGVNIGAVVVEINKKTAAFNGMQVPVKVEVDDQTKEFTISIGTPPAAALIKQETGLKKASGRPNTEFVADLKIEQIIKIAKMKEDGLTGKTLKEKVREIIGTCNSMGVEVEGVKAIEALKLVSDGKFDEKISSEKTELTAEELKALEAEKEHMQAELAAKHAQEEATAKQVLDQMQGKDRPAIKAKMIEAGVSSSLIDKLLPTEEKAEAPAAPAEEKK